MKLDLRGRRFDKLVVIQSIETTKSGQRWLCLCDCGNHITKLTTTLMHTTTTGCKRCEPLSRAVAHLKHGACRGENAGGKTRLYRVWKSMRKRCRDPRDSVYKYYGGKGVRVCDEWQNFTAFRAWSFSHGYVEIKKSPRKDTLSIDRIDPNGHYESSNCQWVTCSENSRRMLAAKRKTAASIGTLQ